jgi:phage gpG-like protein
MADLEIRVESTLNKELAAIAAQGRSIDKALPIIAEMLVGGVHDVFEAEGPGWEPLADSTVARRRGTSHKILQDTGIMAGSISPQHGSTWAEAVDGTSYGIFHTSSAPREKIPLRDFFDLGPFEGPLLDEVADLLAGQF